MINVWGQYVVDTVFMAKATLHIQDNKTDKTSNLQRENACSSYALVTKSVRISHENKGRNPFSCCF